MKGNYYLLMILMAIWSIQGCTQNQKTGAGLDTAEGMNVETSLADDDITGFFNKAASGGMMEVQLGTTAEQNSRSQGVKNFGTMMVKDHGKANEELKALAAAKNITLPATISEDHQKHVNELTPLRGPEFDEKYMKMMVDDHQEDIELFEKAAKFNDAEVSAFANKTLPVLRKHLVAAKKISDGLK